MASSRFPDLDPRTDAHVLGPLTLGQFLVLLGGSTACFLVTWGVLGIFVRDGIALFIALIPALLWGLWVFVDGPRMMQLRRSWRHRQTLPHYDPPGFPITFPADHAGDPFWRSQQMIWGVARLTLPPVQWIENGALNAWHNRLAQAIRMAVAHGVAIDIRAAQLVGSSTLPPATLNAVTRERWQWWGARLGPSSLESIVLVRLGWPRPSRDEAALHFEAVEQAWRAAPGPGEWQWLSADMARQFAMAAAHPAQAYANWQAALQERLQQPPRIMSNRHNNHG